MNKHAVLVTGASSGIGRECALLLAKRGFQVFGGVRTTDAVARLSDAGGASIQPVIMDVRNETSIRAAERMVSSGIGNDTTFSLVNNAGITVAGPLELLETDAVREQFEVNVFGPVSVIRIFLPLLRGHRGRIVFMGSIFGKIAFPFIAPYAAAKFSLEAVADSLALELRESRIHVTLLEPGNISTPLWGKTKTRVIDAFSAVPPDRYAIYKESLDSLEKLTDYFSKTGIQPIRVARTVLRTLSARRPRSRYRVGWDSQVYGRLAPLLPGRLRYWILWRIVLRR